MFTFSRLELMAIRRLNNGARILRTYFNETSLQKWVDAGIARWGNAGQSFVVRS